MQRRVPPPGPRPALGELLRHHRGRLALGSVLDLAEAFGYYGIFALLSVVVLGQVEIGHAQVPFFFIVGNVGALAAAGVGLLAWTSTYPTFTELFPTHLRGVGFSVAVGIIGTLALPGLATRLGATASYLLVIACWLAGVAAIAVFRLRGGSDAATRPLESLSPSPA